MLARGPVSEREKMAPIDTRTPRSRWVKLLAVLAMTFGGMTLFSGGSVLFGPAEMQKAAGDYMPFVLWFNFLAGILYIGAAIGIWLRRSWALGLAAFIATTTALVALGFGYQVSQGAAYEIRTIGALALRFGVWVIISLALMRAGSQK